MVQFLVDPAQLNIQAQNIVKTKYFPIELSCSNMIPNAQYNAFVGSTNVNDLCKPYGGKLGQQIVASATGKVIFQFMVAVQYNQQYLVNPIADENSLVNGSLILTLIDPFNRSSTVNIPVLLKAG